MAGRDCAGLSIGDAVAGLSTGTIFGAQPAKPTAKSRTSSRADVPRPPIGGGARCGGAPAAAAAAAAGEAADGEPETAFETVLTHYPAANSIGGGAETLRDLRAGGRDGAV